MSHKDLAKLCWESYNRYEDFGTFSCNWAIYEDQVICAFTGSNDRVDWIYNARIHLIDSEIPHFVGKCHIGYMDLSIEVARCLRMILKGRYPEYKKLVLTGHSLGGALAIMSSLRLSEYEVDTITFGAPKVFDKKGALSYNRGTHYINGMDIIPHLPRYGYSHYRNTIWLNRPTKYISFIRQNIPTLSGLWIGAKQHSMEQYYNVL